MTVRQTSPVGSRIAARREHDQRGRSVDRQGPRDLEALDVWEADVQQHIVGLEGLGGRDARGAINGLPDHQESVRLEDIADGLSQTAAFSERVKGIGLSNDGQPPDNTNPPGSVIRIGKVPDDAELVYAICNASNPHAPGALLAGNSSIGSFWHIGTMSGTRYNHVMPPNSWSCAQKNSDNDGAHTAGSRHPGVVNVLMTDGSVRAVKSSINRLVWRALGTRAGSEVVSGSDY